MGKIYFRSHHIINGDLNDEKIRLSTYVNYPHNATDFPTLLAENGLYYLNNVGENESKVKCNFCSFVIPIDQKRDRIINIHNQTSLECPLVANSICLNKPMIAKHESKEIFLKELIRNQSLESFKTCQLLIFPPVNSGNATLETTSKRRATFLSWPKEKHLNAQELSEAGFLYTGLSDCVRCLWCNVGLHEWEAGDSPWVEHARFSPECQYVTKEMGQFFIEKSKELSSNQDRIYGIVVNKIPAARFVARCAESGACHYHEAGRRCTGKSCAGIKDEPKYSRFITYTSRLATLVPGSRYKDMKHMIADAGYFYDNKSLCCFDCGDKKFTINPNDVLMIEHAKTSPQCGYIRRQIGDEFIHIIQELLKSYDITFEMLKEHLPRYEQWFTEDSVKRRRKSEQNDDSVVMVLDEIRGSSQKKQACAFCEKENSAVRGLSCCKTVCCADCPYTRKLCLCGMPIDQSTQGPV